MTIDPGGFRIDFGKTTWRLGLLVVEVVAEAMISAS